MNNEIIGYALIALPFLACFAVSVKGVGIRNTLVIIALVAASVYCLYLGVGFVKNN